MPGIIGALTKAANPFSILTKGTLVLRDIELLAAAADVTDVGLNVSVGIVDKELSRLIEPGTPAPDRRLAACAALNERGLRCGVLMGPVLPFLTDSPSQLDRAVRDIAAAGATHVSPIVLHLRTGAQGVVRILAARLLSGPGSGLREALWRQGLRASELSSRDSGAGSRAGQEVRRGAGQPRCGAAAAC